jgi:hypothetical protein
MGDRDVRIYLAERVEADRSSPGANSYYFEKPAKKE